jgi:shikimate dehydrogenase
MPPIDAHTKVIAVLGYPIEHSLSPLIHNTAFRQQGLNYAYVAAGVSPGDLKAAVAGLKALGFGGANVTIPHKQAVLELMDELSEQARAVGAVNTIVCRKPVNEEERVTLYGDNTDVAGFLGPLVPATDRLREKRMLIFGAGGAARAVAYALLSTFQPERLYIVARTPEKAQRLVDQLRPFDAAGVLEVTSEHEAGEAVHSSRLLVNATPLGMYPDVQHTPWPDTDSFTPDQIAYDLIYNPEETRFLREASACGASPIPGLDMLIGQAAAAYVQWTGREMPVDAVRTALNERFTTVSTKPAL